MRNDDSFAYTHNLPKTFIDFVKNKYYSFPCLIALFNVFITYFTVIYLFDIHSHSVYSVLILNIVIFCIFSYVIIKDIYTLRRDSKKTHYGSRFRYRLVLLFTIAAILPVLLLGLFSSLAFKKAAESWFDNKVEKAVNNAENVAEAYLTEHNRNIRADIFATEADLQKSLIGNQSPETVWEQVKVQLLLRDLSSITIFNQSGEQIIHLHSKYQSSKIDNSKKLQLSKIIQIFKDELVIEINNLTYQLSAYKKLRLNNKTYILNITRSVSYKAVKYNDDTKKAVNDYNRIKKERDKSELGFALIYISFGVMIIIFMVKTGQYFALQMTIPLEMLTLTALRIEAGDNNARCPQPIKIRDEIDRLAIAFNQMIDKLSSEKKLTDAVLKGVSTGVICLNNHHHISLINQRALDIFKVTYENIQNLANLSPDFDDFSDLLKNPNAQITSQKYNKLYTLTNGDKVHLHIRYHIHDDSSNTIRYIITIDDVSELMRVQSAAAWQDIAQRIAHEIKNPLTPILLATEHIERKWSKEIQNNQQAFIETLGIIQKQVSHIKDTANSLARFAKMPPPIFTKIDIYKIIYEATLLENFRNSQVKFYLEKNNPIYISGDERLLSQAMINIFKNSSEAIESNNILDGYIQIDFQLDAQQITIKIRDNGGGLPKDIPQHELFNPYVSTKDNGTGIGLAIIAKIITDHNGQIFLQNHYDNHTKAIIGAEAIIYFPLEINSNKL